MADRSEFMRASIMAAAGVWIGYLVGPNAMVAATNSNFLAVLPDALNTSSTAVSTALAISLWLVAIAVPIMGRTMDRFGVRAVILPGVLLFGLCYIALGQVQNLWQFVTLQALLALPVAMCGSVGYAKIIATWFDRNRGLVMGFCVAFGAGLGQTIMPKASDALIQAYGWRGGYVGIGLIILVLGLPFIFWLARTPAASLPQTSGDSGKTPPDEMGLNRAEAVRLPVFYLIFFAMLFGSMALLGTMQHTIPLLKERGLALSDATTIMSVAFAGVVVGQFSSGFIVDRYHTPRVILPFFVSALIGLAVLYSATLVPVLLTGAFIMGLGLGGEVGQNAYLVSRYFGLKAFGTIYGLTFAASSIGNGVGTILLGYLRDLNGNYDGSRLPVLCFMAISVTCIALLPAFTFAGPKKA